jgi:putative Mn2+ efflux pump MntP
VTPAEHNKTLATLHYIYGAMHGLTLLGLLLLVIVVGMATPELASISTAWFVSGVVVFVLLFLAVGLLPVIVGYGLSKRNQWARPAAILLGIISLINIPIGTALGIYAIKFLRSEAGSLIYGGKSSTATNDVDLQKALSGARPLMDLAKRLK